MHVSIQNGPTFQWNKKIKVCLYLIVGTGKVKIGNDQEMALFSIFIFSERKWAFR